MGGDVSQVKIAVSGPNMPKALGPYSQAIRLGDLLFVSGQAGLNPETGEVAGSDFEAQARQAFENLRAILEAAGSGMDQVVKTTGWVANADDFPKFNELYAEYFPQDAPARSTPIVALPRGLLISIECIAAAPA